MTLHQSVEGPRMLHVVCYVDECKRAFAVLVLHEDEGKP